MGLVTFWRAEKDDAADEGDEDETSAPLPKKIFSRWRNKSVAEIKDTSDLGLFVALLVLLLPLRLMDFQFSLPFRTPFPVDQGQKIHKLMAASCRKLEVNRASEEWHAYVEYVNSVVRDGVFHAIETALGYLIGNMEVLLFFLFPFLLLPPPASCPSFRWLQETLLLVAPLTLPLTDSPSLQAVTWNRSKLNKTPVVRLCDMKMDLMGNSLVFSPDISGGE